ncbi:MAG TPA: L-histidine N(alpha)-methyltransferase [Thermoleophilaceae bacterium]
MSGATIRIDSHMEASGSLGSMADDVRAGLSGALMELSPKYFYDDRGSELFEQITSLPEYYPTRCEREILNRRAPEIVELCDPLELVELGSGVASKTRALLYAMAGADKLRRYVPVDVSEAVVTRCAEELTEAYPGLEVHGVVGDFLQHLDRLPDGERRMVAFLGSTIGNLHPADRTVFLAAVRDLLGPGDRLVLGLDLVKDVRVLEAAYNDSAGVTAEFNLNMLHAINAALGADFEPAAFEHVAFFEPEHSWVEMRLRASEDQRITIPGAALELDLEAGDEIRTEISTKFTREGITAELADAGMAMRSFFTDERGWFGLAVAARV